jgi:hypothetical protein
LGAAAKNNAPKRGSASVAAFFIFIGFVYIAHFWPKSKPYGDAKPQFGRNKPAILSYRLMPAAWRAFPEA